MTHIGHRRSIEKETFRFLSTSTGLYLLRRKDRLIADLEKRRYSKLSCIEFRIDIARYTHSREGRDRLNLNPNNT